MGEFGTFGETSEDMAWLTSLLGYAHAERLSFAFWCLNPNSGDTGGLLLDDWATLHEVKHRALEPLLAEATASTDAAAAAAHT